MVDERRKASGAEGPSPAGGSRMQGVGERMGSLLYENRRIVIASACLLVFIALLNRVLAGQIMVLDRAAIELMVEHVRAAWLTPVMEAVSFAVTPAPLIAGIFATALGCRLRGVRGVGVFCAVNLVGSTLLNQALKFAIQRPRPDVALRLVDIGGFSFPSGHSMAAMAFFGLLIWLVWHGVRSRGARSGLVTVLCVAICAVGFSRVYLGVHYASDVLAGFCASLAWLVAYTKVAGPMLGLARPCGRVQ